jgi:integrase
MNLTRTRYQQGSLSLEKRKNGPSVWVYRWREADSEGTRIRRKVVVGSKVAFPSRTAATKQIANLGLEINSELPAPTASRTVAELIEHYRKIELMPNSGKTALTIDVYEGQLARYILPKWGSLDIGKVKAVAVEAWLKTRPRPGDQSEDSQYYECGLPARSEA